MGNHTAATLGPPFGPVDGNGTIIVVFWEYKPNQSAAYAFVALFALTTICQFLYLFMLRPRPWYFIPFILGGIGETFGYYGRSMAATEPTKLGPWIMQNLLLLASPPFIAATIYMTFGQVCRALDANKLAVINPRWLTKIYVLIDIVCIISQFAGTVMPASGDPDAIELSKKIVLAGLILQVVALAFFILTCWQVHRKLKSSAEGGFKPPGDDTSVHWQNHFRSLELVTVLLLVRSLVRMVEYAQGSSGYVASHEVFIYVFDSAPIFLIMLIWTIIHPQRLVRDATRAKSASWEM